MRKLSEVTRLTGLSRKALQGYSDIGLQGPTAQTASKYWMYDDSAIMRLTLIHGLSELGYMRRDIKAMLESPETDLHTEFDRAIGKLEEQIRRCQGKIRVARWLRQLLDQPQAPEAVVRRATIRSMERQRLTDQWEDAVEVAAEEPEFNSPVAYALQRLYTAMAYITLLREGTYTPEEQDGCMRYFDGALTEFLVCVTQAAGESVITSEDMRGELEKPSEALSEELCDELCSMLEEPLGEDGHHSFSPEDEAFLTERLREHLPSTAHEVVRQAVERLQADAGQ